MQPPASSARRQPFSHQPKTAARPAIITHGIAGMSGDRKPAASRPYMMSSGHSIPRAIARVASLNVKTPKISCLWRTSTTTLIQSMKGTAMVAGQTIPAAGRIGLESQQHDEGHQHEQRPRARRAHRGGGWPQPARAIDAREGPLGRPWPMSGRNTSRRRGGRRSTTPTSSLPSSSTTAIGPLRLDDLRRDVRQRGVRPDLAMRRLARRQRGASPSRR